MFGRPPQIRFQVRSLTQPSTETFWQDLLFQNYLTSTLPDLNPGLVQRYPAIQNYTKYFDEPINIGLRKNQLSLLSYQIIQQIYSALNQSKSYPSGLILFRGVESTPKFPIKSFKVGDQIQDPGFMSKSPVVVNALEFARPGCCLLIIRYPQESRHLDLSSISKFKEEKEFLSYPGEIFQISDILELSNPASRYQMKAFVLDYVGNQYTQPEMITSKINLKIDSSYPEFLKCVPLDQAVYFADDNIIISPFNGGYESSFSRDDVIIKITTSPKITFPMSPEDINARLYTLYASGKAQNVYVLPDWNRVREFYFERPSIKYREEYLPGTSHILTHYAKGNIENINGWTPSRIKLSCAEELYLRVFGG